jgi:hypothetical protein
MGSLGEADLDLDLSNGKVALIRVNLTLERLKNKGLVPVCI